MDTESDIKFLPDPRNCEATKKQRLLELAKEHRVLRISAEKGLSVDEAIRVIETYHHQVDKAAFPVSKYGMLK
jgi:hypothetical protein